MTYGGGPGGRIPPDNRPTQAPGVGKNSKRHDLERRSTPYLHDSDLQQGDVQALSDGQRVAPKQTQRPAAARPTQGSGNTMERTSPAAIPDAIDFISEIGGGAALSAPPAGVIPTQRLDMWVRFAERLVNGPGSSGLLAGAYINQLRALLRSPQAVDSVYIDMNDVDGAIEAMLDEDEDGAPGGE
jgi:hypothetical protein